MRILSLGLAALTFLAQGVSHAEVIYKKANGKGKVVSVALKPSETAGVDKIVFWFVSRGNVGTPINVTLNGPVKARASMQAKIIKGNPSAALQAANGWYKIAMNEDDLVIKETAFSKLALKSCDDIPQSFIQFVIELYARVGQTPTAEDICDFWQSSGDVPTDPVPTPGPDQPNYNYKHGYLNERGVLQKDSCGTKSSAQYLVRMTVNVENLNPDAISGGYELLATFNMYPYLGSRAASVKPESDGRFAPQPLLLMNSVGGFGQNEHVNVYSWKRGIPTITQQLKVEDYVPYQGLFLGRIVATPALTGSGRATFLITNGVSAYSVCFARKRTRQKVNGYP